ncbi:MAG: entericidin A/B family lipoprotein [Phycisphaerales bacterium]
MKIRDLMKALFMFGVLSGASWMMVGCNTMEGAGEDVEEAGDAIEDAADG